MGHLNSFSAWGGRNLNKNFPKIRLPWELPGGGGGIFKLRFDWYIRMKKSIGNFKGKNFYFFPTGGGGVSL